MSPSKEKVPDFQEELQEYIKEKDLHAKFISLVESILIEKPDNPIGFMEKYPSETKEATAEFTFQANLENGSEQKNCPTAVPIEESDDSDSDSDESVSGQENDDGNASHDDSNKSDSQSIPKVVKRTKRRASVCAEKLCPTKMMESSEHVVKKIPKSDEEAKRIQQILQKNVLFQHLDPVQLLNVQDAMFLVEKENDDIIIQQGDDGDNFYLIDQGSVDVFIRQSDNDLDCSTHGKLVASYSDGDSFGELAIMYNAPRAATCIAKGDDAIRLWAIDRVSFKVIMMQTAITKRNIHKGFLKQVPILSELTEYEILTIADALQEESFEDGDIICNENEAGNRFYIIKEGTAVCRKTISDSEGNEFDKEVARLENGSYFGEIALITSKPRQATVTASGTLKCLSLDRKTFKRVMGCLQEILMRNMETYNRFQAANI